MRDLLEDPRRIDRKVGIEEASEDGRVGIDPRRHSSSPRTGAMIEHHHAVPPPAVPSWEWSVGSRSLTRSLPVMRWWSNELKSVASADDLALSASIRRSTTAMQWAICFCITGCGSGTSSDLRSCWLMLAW